MGLPKRVAIIGAGPSGLTMAKTLLHNSPQGAFHPVIFEKKHRLGGLWAVDYPGTEEDCRGRSTRGLVDPFMQTNVSRFSVAFSDLAWESALGGGGDVDVDVPMFPRAWQVRRYLEKYASVYIPESSLRLGRRVVRAIRRSRLVGSGGRWEVHWVDEREHEEHSTRSSDGSEIMRETFDFLVVASGHFGAPYIPDIPGFASFPATVHSSGLQNAEDISRLLENAPAKGKVVVIGGSMSGVEAATSLALHLSSLNFKPGSSEQSGAAYEVYHLSTSPFWVLPTCLPHQYSSELSKAGTMPLLPLDLFLYDLSRRAPGTPDFSFGPKSPEQVSGIYKSFRAMLGNDYSKIGGVNITDREGKESARPPWVAISDYYAEFIRCGAIKPWTGRAYSVECSASSLGSINVGTPDGLQRLTEVAAIVMATGFSPSESLSFFKEDVLSTLEHSHSDHFLPLVLDGFCSSHSDIPDLGFVGFYRGAFWGPAELQAQILEQRWRRIDPQGEVTISAEDREARTRERQTVRDFRNLHPTSLRGQFPLGDYVGLMESLARQLERIREPLVKDLPIEAQPLGPVVPVRYHPTLADGDEAHGNRLSQKGVEITMNALKHTLIADSARARLTTAAAIFRALHGKWRFTRETRGYGAKVSGTATFYPRYPSSLEYEKEYLYEEVQDGAEATRLVYRLCEDTSALAREAQVRIWSIDQSSPNSALQLLHELKFGSAGEVMDSGDYRVQAFDITGADTGGVGNRYEFVLNRVAVRSWSCTAVTPRAGDDEAELSMYAR
ncbi:uncharacterized protein BJX67DRAFT_185274 [Aspergillus lucknowensis]|uniref:FAD/NAD(P)-binding domain-containing protein n=1 Tax=Aspergillus lucknowensis TaxID=176173 RepID=A0ABR4LLM1_9EURO